MKRALLLFFPLALLAFAGCGGSTKNTIPPPPVQQSFALLSEAPGGLFQPTLGNLNGTPFKAFGQASNIWSIASSPNGKKVAFDMNPNSQWDIYVSDSDGSHLVQITNDADSDYEPTFSADGSKVIFTSYRGNSGSFGFDIMTANSDGTGLTDLTPNSALDHRFAVFSPDGTKIAFSAFDSVNVNWGIWMMNADGTGLQNVLRDTNYDAYALPITFDPSGTKIFYSGVTIDPTTVDIYSVNVDGSNVQKLTNTGIDWYPRFLGNTIVFNSYRDGNAEIYTMKTDGSGVTRVTNNAAYEAFSQSFYVGSASALAKSRLRQEDLSR